MFNFFKLSGQQLCNSDKNLPIEFKFMNRHGVENVYLGTCKTTVDQIIQKKEFELTNSLTRAAAGHMTIDSIKLVEKPSFIEYLRSGWQINLHVAIDFTASNGESSLPTSLHFL